MYRRYILLPHPPFHTTNSFPASTGDICAVRCFNAANFGGCFAVQQTDTTPSKNSPEQIATTQTLDGINKQVAQNVKDLPAAVDAINGASLDGQGKALAEGILAADPGIEGAASSVGSASSTTSAAGTAATGAVGGNGNGNGNGGATRGGNGNGRGNSGNGNGNGNGRGNGNGNGGNGNGGNGNGNARGGRNNNNKRNINRVRRSV